MGRGTFISAALHGAILLWVLVAFPSSNMDSAPLVAIPIDLATPGDVTKIKAGTKDSKDDGVLAGKPEEKKPQAAKEAKPPEQTTSLDDKAQSKPDDKKDKPANAAAAKPDAQKQDDKPAKNMFAAGEIMAGSILGKGYLAGFGMTIGTIFGRIAGKEASRHVNA